MRSAFAAILLASVTSCGASATEPSTSELLIGSSTVRLTMTATASQLPPGTRDTLTAILTNEGPSAVTLHFPSGCIILSYIRNSAGTIVLPDGGG